MIFCNVSENEIGTRLDVFLAQKLDVSRNYASILVDEGYVFVNDVEASKVSYKIKLNDKIEVEEKETEVLNVESENVPLNILYEDNDILIINKIRGMVVHPSLGHEKGTLVNAIMHHCKDNLSTINGVIRPGIVHRIDKDTSGVLCICKNDKAHNDIALQFQEHTNVRKYLAIVKGVVKDDEGFIDEPILRDKKNRKRYAVDKNGKVAKTFYKVLKRFENYTYVECELFTGRTHQIRVHMAHIGHPLLGDMIYGRKDNNFKDLDGQILHAYYLELTHPGTKERIKFETDIPDYFKEILDKLQIM